MKLLSKLQPSHLIDRITLSKLNVDVVIVLGAKSSHTASEALKRRIDCGTSIFQDCHAKHLLLCGGSTKNFPAEADLMAEIAIEAGVPKDRIIIEDRSRSTWDNAAFASEVIEQYCWRNACIVSDSFHLPRAWLVFRRTPLGSINLYAAEPLPASTAFCMCIHEIFAITWYLLRLAVTRR